MIPIDSFWTVLLIRPSSKVTSGQRLSLHRSHIIKVQVSWLPRIQFSIQNWWFRGTTTVSSPMLSSQLVDQEICHVFIQCKALLVFYVLLQCLLCSFVALPSLLRVKEVHRMFQQCGQNVFFWLSSILQCIWYVCEGGNWKLHCDAYRKPVYGFILRLSETDNRIVSGLFDSDLAFHSSIRKVWHSALYHDMIVTCDT